MDEDNAIVPDVNQQGVQEVLDAAFDAEQQAESQVHDAVDAPAIPSALASRPRLDMLEQQQHELLEQQQLMADAVRRIEEQQDKLLKNNETILNLLQQLLQRRRESAAGSLPPTPPPVPTADAALPPPVPATPAEHTIPYAPAILNTPQLQVAPIAAPQPAADPLVGLQTQVAHLTAQLAGLKAGAAVPPRVERDPLERDILKQITAMKDFDGKGNVPWLEFQQAFESKASLVSSLPKTEWVKYIHSHVTGSALLHARSVGLVVDGVLQPVSFEEYCSRMNVAMFGEVLTPAGNFIKLCSISQEGALSDPLAFIREKEKYLNKIPVSSLSPDLRAAACLMRMDKELRVAVQTYVRARPGIRAMGHEFQFQSYEELKGAVLAVHTMQSEVFAQGNRLKRGAYQGQGQAFSPAKSPRLGGGSSNIPAQPTQPTQPTQGASGFRPGRLPFVPFEQRRCKHCGQVGHYNMGFVNCPMHPRNKTGDGGASGSGSKAPPPPPPAKSGRKP